MSISNNRKSIKSEVPVIQTPWSSTSLKKSMDGSLVSGKKIMPLNYDHSQNSIALSQDQRITTQQDEAPGSPTQKSFTSGPEGSKNPNNRRDHYLNILLNNSVGSRTQVFNKKEAFDQ